jgi:hypothetical protein
MPDYGEDLGGIEDLDAELSFVSGLRCLAENLCCRLGNIPGTAEDEPTNGYDLTLVVGDVVDAGEVEQKIVEQMKADERVASATAKVVQNGSTLTVTIGVVASGGEAFEMVISVTVAAVKLVEFNLQEAA